MLYEPKKNARSIWRLVYGKIQYKNDLPTINMGILGGHCFYIKKMDVLSGRWECKGCRHVYDQGIVTYEQNKLGLSAYYDNRYVLADGIHPRPLDF